MKDSFLMKIDDVFTIEGRGVVVVGRIESGIVKVNDTVEIISNSKVSREVVVTGVEMFNKVLDEASAGNNVGCLLRGVSKEDIKIGDYIATPGSFASQNN